MHELQITEKILNIVLAHSKRNNAVKVIAVNLKIGELSDLENEWIQRYFSYLAKGSIAAAARLKIEREAAMARCDSCRSVFRFNIQETKKIQCPECGSGVCGLISGRGYRIEDMEVI